MRSRSRPQSPDVRFIVADAYTYGQPDLERAFAEAILALEWGLDTPRVHAILATAYNAFGDLAPPRHIETHFELVTTELSRRPARRRRLADPRLGAWADLRDPRRRDRRRDDLDLDQQRRLLGLIASCLRPTDRRSRQRRRQAYFAGFEWVAEETGTYRLQVTLFESVNYGELVVTIPTRIFPPQTTNAANES